MRYMRFNKGHLELYIKISDNRIQAEYGIIEKPTCEHIGAHQMSRICLLVIYSIEKNLRKNWMHLQCVLKRS